MYIPREKKVWEMTVEESFRQPFFQEPESLTKIKSNPESDCKDCKLVDQDCSWFSKAIIASKKKEKFGVNYRIINCARRVKK